MQFMTQIYAATLRYNVLFCNHCLYPTVTPLENVSRYLVVVFLLNAGELAGDLVSC